MEIIARPVALGDRDEWLRLRLVLWPDSTADEVDDYFRHGGFRIFERSTVIVADNGDGRLAGFTEASVRPFAEGCMTSPVAYLEGWYVSMRRCAAAASARACCRLSRNGRAAKVCMKLRAMRSSTTNPA